MTDTTTDDAIERAARAMYEAQRTPGDTPAWDGLWRPEARDYWLRLALAALAAAGAGAEVDREACPHCPDGHTDPTTRPWGVFVAEERDGDGQPTRLVVQPSNGAHVAEADAEWLRTLLAARGDATPTEVEWGVRYMAPKGKQRIARTDRQDDAESAAAATGGDVMQRTVSAWREVEGGEQRA